jgi:hypothetical protein
MRQLHFSKGLERSGKVYIFALVSPSFRPLFRSYFAQGAGRLLRWRNRPPTLAGDNKIRVISKGSNETSTCSHHLTGTIRLHYQWQRSQWQR